VKRVETARYDKMLRLRNMLDKTKGEEDNE
jgi:hypothetical protein